ncbi:ABC transporter permease [Mycolicibacterium smegmatis]|uniref:ABC transporter permease n=1 Tax=Mycolicibacterium smegmatis TaxID=1772 RepID=UPI001E432110|nr:ABC transporter permease [Mycolicibacterium smegmatis]UGU33122.1 ABC transporter permease [Mycolicibacterium smegmatis]ULN68001.1 ABC transporter permease [Mycolicibacterium smegmatis]
MTIAPTNPSAVDPDSAIRATQLVTANGWRQRLRPFLRPQIVIGAAVVVIWLLIIASASFIAPHDPFAASGPRLEAPSAAHIFGTDALGRDVFSRVLYGARQSLPVALATITIAAVVGGLVGAVAGFFGGFVDTVLMRLADITMAFPSILLAMAVTAALGPGLTHAFIAIVVVWWPIYARLIRGQILTIKEQDHVMAATAIGVGRWRTLFKHVLPHSLTPVVVSATMDLGTIIILIASLSFLGLGALPPSPEWGAMITEGAANFYQWWIAAGPGIAMVSVVLAINFLGDGLRETLDLKLRPR